MFPDLNALLRRLIHVADLAMQWRFAGALAHAVDWCRAVQRFMLPVPVVVMHPHGKLAADIGCSGVHRCPELLEDSPLRALDLAIQMRRSGRDGSELDRLSHEPALDRFGEELRTPVSLYALDGKRHL